jgi:hypothetical protein
MRIGSDDNFLRVEKVGQRGPTVTWRVVAAVGGPGWWFAALHHCVEVSDPCEAARRIADFTGCKVQRIEIILLQGGWFRIKRHPSGSLLVRYRVGQANSGAALEGEVSLNVEAADAFCRQLGDLL